MRSQGAFHDWYSRRKHKYDAIVLDIDGVLMCGHRPMRGADRFLARLRSEGVVFSLLTNDPTRSPAQRSAVFAASGIHIDPLEIISASHGISLVARRLGLAGRKVFVLGALGDPCYAAAAGMEVVRDPERLDECEAVILSEKDFDWETSFNALVNYYFKRKGGVLIAPNPDKHFINGHGDIALASGLPAVFIKDAMRSLGIAVNVIYTGKPYRVVFQYNHEVMEERAGFRIRRDRVVMVGDSLEADMAGARRFGYDAGLVLGGITSREMLAAAGACRPDYLFDSI